VISDTLLGRRHCGMNGLYNSAAVEGYAEMLCCTLDNSISSLFFHLLCRVVFEFCHCIVWLISVLSDSVKAHLTVCRLSVVVLIVT